MYAVLWTVPYLLIFRFCVHYARLAGCRYFIISILAGVGVALAFLPFIEFV